MLTHTPLLDVPMLRKLLLALVLLILLAVGGMFALLATNSDILIDRFNAYVKESTGAPLVTQTRPEITLFPNRGLELGAGSWESPDGALNISFSRASVQISSHALFTGHFRIKNFSVDDLSVTLQVQSALWQNLNTFKKDVGYRPPDEIVRFILRTLQIAPDNITVRRGQIRLVQPDQSSVTLAPLSLSASNVHPGSDTDFNLHTMVSGESPEFRASVDLRCTALFTKDKAAFTIAKAQLTPEHGLPFQEHVSLSGGLEYDFASSGLTLSQLHFQGPELSVTASGSIASLARLYQDTKQADASLRLAVSGDPQRVAKILNRPLPLADDECFKEVEVSTELRWVSNLLHMNAIQGKADDMTFAGRLSATLPHFDISGELKFGNVHLASYQTPAAGGRASRAAPRDFRRWPRLNLQISADEVTWKKLTLQQVRARMTGQNGTYEFNPLTGILLGSPMTASLTARLLPSTPLSALVSMHLSLPQTNVAELCRIVMTDPLVSGRGTLNASLSFNSIRGLSSLNGKGSLSSAKAQTSFSLLPSDLPLREIFSYSGELDRLFCSFDVQRGIMTLNTFAMEAPRLSLNCSGNIDLPERTIAAGGMLRVSGSSAFPVRIQGDLAAPHYTLDLPAGREGSQPKRIELDLKLPPSLHQFINP